MALNLADIFEHVVDAVGEREALTFADRRYTYAQIEEQANRIAHVLSDAGIRPGDHVGMYLTNCPEYVIGMIACLKIRAVPVNVNFRYVEGELRYLFDNADLVALFHRREFCPRIAAVRDEVPALGTFIMVEDESGADTAGLPTVDFDEALGKGSLARDFGPRSDDDLFIIYTGGTTGMPKGVMWRHEDMFRAALGSGNPLAEPMNSPEEVAANAASRGQVVQFMIPPLIHGSGQLQCFISFNWGDRLVVAPRFDPDEIWDTVERERVNTMSIVGDAMARPLAEALAVKPRDTSSVLYLGSAGALFSESVKEQLRALLPNAIVTESFGATETGHQGSAAPEARSEDGGLRFVMNERTAVIDDDGNMVAPGSGATGKLALGGHIPLGYYKDEEKTKATFVEVGGKRWVLPGDHATVDADGTITVFGRGSQCINTGGEKVYPEEVEEALRAHPAIYDAVVVGVPDERWGERVAAVVQLRDDASLTTEEMKEHARSQVAGYKVPRELHLVDAIARQPSGKPDYPWAKALATEGSARA